MPARHARGGRPARARSRPKVARLPRRGSGTGSPTLRERAAAPGRQALDMAGRQKQSQEVRDAFDTPFEKRDRRQEPRRLRRLHRPGPGGEGRTARRSPTIRAGGAEGRHDDGRPRADQSPARDAPARSRATSPGPAEVVAPGVPAVLPPLEASRRSRRTGCDLARWLVDPRQPADGAGGGQPDLAGLLRPGPGRDRERLRHAGDAADASGAARLAGHRVRRAAAGA